MYKKDLVLNDLQWLMSHKTKLDQTIDYCQKKKMCENFFFRKFLYNVKTLFLLTLIRESS